MHYTHDYQSPFGKLLLAADETGLTGLWFEGQKYFGLYLDKTHTEKNLPVFEQADRWLDLYFSGKDPGFGIPLHFIGTDFQNAVWAILASIPYGKTMTYGEIAQKIQCASAQAVGGAVGKNPLSVFVPCHRVLGSQGQLTGYAGGLERKRWLLSHEGVTF